MIKKETNDVLKALEALKLMDVDTVASLLAESGLAGTGVLVKARDKARDNKAKAMELAQKALDGALKEFQGKLAKVLPDGFKGKIQIDFSGDNPEAKIKMAGSKKSGTSGSKRFKQRDVLNNDVRAIIDCNLDSKAWKKLGSGWLELDTPEGPIKMTGTILAFRLFELSGGSQKEAHLLIPGLLTEGQIKGAFRSYPKAVESGRIYPEDNLALSKKPKKEK